MEVWLKFFFEFNGIILFFDMYWLNGDILYIFFDSFGFFGCGVIFGLY